MNDDQLKHLSELQAKYADQLMAKAHVIGVGVGMAMREGVYTDEPALVVMVNEKVPLSALAESDVVPSTLDDMRVDVQPVGGITTF